MPAMTMPFTVPSESDLQILAPDDEITATLVVDGSHSWLEELIITRQSATTSAVPAVVLAKEGDEVPNYTLRNQDNREIRIRNYRGKALLLTFIYTRCPVPDYCTLMSNNFAQVDRALGQDRRCMKRRTSKCQHRSGLRHAAGAAELWRCTHGALPERDFCTLGVCDRDKRSGEGDCGVFWI